MIKYAMLTLLVLTCGLPIGCVPESEYPEYNRARVAKVRTDAMIKQINNKAELDGARHKIHMMAVENEADVQRLARECRVELTKTRFTNEKSILSANYKAADSLLKKLPAELAKDSPILVASFVNLDDLNDSSTFGRVVSEHFASRFKQGGYTTMEMKLRTKVFIKAGLGEFMLSRELAEIGIKHRARAVAVGTYAVASKRVYLTTRVVNVSDGSVLSSYDYDIPITFDVFKMLLKGKGEDKSGWL